MMEAIIITEGVIALVLKLLNVFLHSIGLYLLRCLPKDGRKTAQMAYITNLSVTELTINVISFLRNLLKLMPFTAFKSQTFKEVVSCSYFVDYAILKFSLYMTMVYITIDRLLMIKANITYPLYWNYIKAKRVLIGTWIVSLLLLVTSVTWYTFTRDANQLILVYNYVLISLDFTFVGIAIVSYCVMFHQFKQRQTGSLIRRSDQGSWKIFRQSRFYVAFLLIFTFILFVVPADLVWTFADRANIPQFMSLVLTIFYAISYLSDGLIYIFGQAKVKKLFLTKFGFLKHRTNKGPDNLSAFVINLPLENLTPTIAQAGD